MISSLLPDNRVAIVANGKEEISEALIEALKASRVVIAIDGGFNFCYEHGVWVDYLVGDLDSIKPSLLKNFPPEKIQRLERAKDLVDLEAGLIFTHEKIDRALTPVIFNANGGRMDHHIHNLFVLMRHPNALLCTKDAVIGVNQVKKDTIAYAFYEGVTLLDADQSISLMPGDYHSISASNILDKGRFISIRTLTDKKLSPVELVPIEQMVFPHISESEDFYMLSEGNSSLEIDAQPGLTISLIPWHGAAENIETEGLKWNLSGDALDDTFVGISNIALGKSVSIKIGTGNLLCIVEKKVIDKEMIDLMDNSSTGKFT